GADIWGAADAFRFVYRPLAGDGYLIARVTGVDNTHGWAKAGVMIREDLTAGGRYAALFVSPTNGLAFQRRTAAGGDSSYAPGSGASPLYLKITRAGNTFTASASPDGTTWTAIGTGTVAMPSAAWIGLAVTSHNNPVVAT